MKDVNNENNTCRIFIGVPVVLSSGFQKDFIELKNQLNRNKISWVKKELMHITIRFLGQVSLQDLVKLRTEFVRFSFDEKIKVNLKGIGFFCSKKSPKVIFTGVEDNESWINLYNQVNKMLEQLNYDEGDKKYSPHLTLGRIRFIIDRKSISSVQTKFESRFRLEQNSLQLCLYESHLTPHGPVYKILESVPLIFKV